MKFTTVHTAVDAFRESKDAESFGCIYQLLSGKLYYVCLRYLKNEADAQDVLQETFITVFKKFDSYSGGGSFEGWVRRIAVNNCLAKLKLDQKQFMQSISDNGAEMLSEEADHFQTEETEAQLLAALKTLPDGYRTIINLAILEDYSHKEIGELLNISEGTSRSQLSRAKVALKVKLEQITERYEA